MTAAMMAMVTVTTTDTTTAEFMSSGPFALLLAGCKKYTHYNI